MFQFPARQVTRYRTVIDRYRFLLSKRKGLVATVLVLSLATAIMEGIGLSIIYPLLDTVIGESQDQGRIWQAIRAFAMRISGTTIIEGLIYLAVGVFLIKAVLLSATAGVTALLVGRLREDWSPAVMRNFLYGAYANIVAERRGKIIHQVVWEPVRATKGVEALLSFLIKLMFAIVLTITLFILNWRLMLAMATLILLAVILARVFLVGRMQKLGRKQRAASQTVTAAVAEPIFGASVVKLLSIEQKFVTTLERALRKLTRNNVLTTIFSNAPSDFVEFFIIVCVVGLFILLSYGFGIPLQEAAPLIGSFAIISQRLLSMVSSLLSKRLNLASVSPSLVLVHELLNRDTRRQHLENGVVLKGVANDIAVRDVWFSYEIGKPVFKGLSLRIPKGTMVGIVGPSGVGKSTLGYLLTRLCEPDRGSVLIDNTDVREFSIDSLRRRIGYVEQTPLLFSGTIEENIRLGAPDATKSQIIEASMAAGAHEFILSLPQGYETSVSDQGATLSGGERQRIAIARAIVRRPDIFIIDEGTSSLDRKAEATIQESIQVLVQNATVIVIAHRVSTLKNADLIYELMPGGEAVVRTFKEVAA